MKSNIGAFPSKDIAKSEGIANGALEQKVTAWRVTNVYGDEQH